MRILVMYNTGIVNYYDVLQDAGFDQVVHGGYLRFRANNMNPHQEEHELRNILIEQPIKTLKAVYVDGIQIVKKGKLFVG